MSITMNALIIEKGSDHLKKILLTHMKEDKQIYE